MRRQNTETFYLECSMLVNNTGKLSLELARVFANTCEMRQEHRIQFIASLICS